jgi:hypothetical protein
VFEVVAHLGIIICNIPTSRAGEDHDVQGATVLFVPSNGLRPSERMSSFGRSDIALATDNHVGRPADVAGRADLLVWLFSVVGPDGRSRSASRLAEDLLIADVGARGRWALPNRL